MQAYVCHRLARAGHTYGNLFTPSANKVLFNSSRGLPRLINILCHKALMVAYGRGERFVTRRAMLSAVHDTEGAFSSSSSVLTILNASLLIGLAVIILFLIKL